MKAAQIAVAVLTGILIAAAAALFIADENAPAWVFAVAGLFGWLMLLAMVLSDARPVRTLPPPRS